MSIAIPFDQMCSSQRPVPLRRREDLVIIPIDFQGVTHYVVKDPVALTYNRLRTEQHELLLLLDGSRSLEQIRDDLVRKCPVSDVTLHELQRLIFDLHQKGMVYGTRTGQAAIRIEQHRSRRWRTFLSGFANILSLKIPGWDPDATLALILRWFGWIFHPITLVLVGAFVVFSWALLGSQFAAFQSSLPAFNQFFGWPNLILLWMTLAGAKVIHEFGHGLTCKYFGAECHEMGVMILVGSPTLYCNVDDSWMLRNKWHRILIGAAGMLVEVVLSSIAIVVWWMTEPGLVHYLSLNLFFVTTLTTVIYNVNPLMRLDGYYMLMDYLEIPDLSAKGEKLLREFIARWIFGIDPEPDPLMPQTGRGWFALFAFASKIYRFIVVYGILIFLYTVLKPYGLQVVGQAMAMAMVFSMGIGFIVSGYRIATTRRHEPINRLRASLGLTLVLGFVIWAGTFPLPLVRWAPFVVEPRDVAHVVTKVPGELIEVHVQPGDHVVPGQLLAKLRDPRLDDRRRALIVKRSLQKKAIELAKAADDPGSRVLAEEALRTVELQLSELDQQLANLTITAPIAGRVIESPRQPPPTLDQSKTRLAGWSGTPLDKKNIGSFLETRTHLLSISPNDEMQAILYLDQSDRHDIDVGSRIGLKFDHLPTSVVRGTVTHIATGHSDFAPEHLSVKNGGLMPTVTNREGREQIDDAAYQVIVLFEDHSEPLLTNLRGTARFYPQRSALSWLWRSLQTTFRFRM